MKKNQFKKEVFPLFRHTLNRLSKLNFIIIVIMLLTFVGSNSAFAQQGSLTIQGKIVSADDNEPIIGATVVDESSKTNGVMTDLDGNFEIKVAPNAALKITYMGFVTQTIAVKDNKFLNIRMVSEDYKLKDFVVVGYGIQKKVNMTAAVSSVSMDELEGKPVTNVVEALQGTTPGLVIQQSNSQPGSRLAINIRGTNTMNENNPLVMIDGIQGDIQSVNQSDIESISILKDAASTSIYGSRASNGVILITTKKGRKGTREIVYDFNYGLQNPTNLPNIVDSWVYAELRNEALVNSGKSIKYTPEQIKNFRENGPNTNWMKELYKSTAPQQTHNLSIAGGSENTTYLISAGYMNQASMFEGPDYGMDRLSGRVNLESQVTSRFKVGVNVAYVRNDIKDHAYNTEWLIEQASRMPSIYAIKDKDGNYTYPSGSNSNALERLEQGGYRQNKNDDLSGVVNGEFKIMDGLKFKAMGGYQLYNNRLHENRKSTKGSGDAENKMTENFERIEDLTANAIVTYDKTFNTVHNFSALIGYGYEGNNKNGFETYRLTDNADYDMLAGSKTENTSNRGWALKRSIYSGFARLNYNYQEKYLFEFNIRNDYSSKFKKGNRSGIFPSFALGWRVSEEAFYSDNLKKIMPSLKIRSSWGQAGNNTIDDYAYQANIGTTPGYNFGSSMVNTATVYATNPLLKWETTNMFNIGADISLLKNALTITADFFNNNTHDILFKRDVPTIVGLPESKNPENLAKVQNRGWELSARYNLKTGNVEHVFSANISDSKNKVTDVKGEVLISGGEVNAIIKEGYAINSYYAYRADGFYQTQEEIDNGPKIPGITPKLGDVRYIDKNGDGLIKEEDDRFVLGNRFPRYTYGFTYQMNWKGVDFSMFWQGVGQRSVWIRGEAFEAFHNNNEGPVFDFHIDRWTPNNRDAEYPRLTMGSESANNAAKSSFYIQNAAYLRLKNLQIGYTIPASVLHKVAIKHVRVFASAQNVLTFSQIKGGWDPETSDAQGGGRIYPVNRVFSVGLNVKF